MTSKYNNTFVYFDPVRNRAYRESATGSLQFAKAAQMTADVKKRCYRFDSQHEYFAYRIVLASLPPVLQLIRQVNFLVIPKNDFAKKVFYRADLVIVDGTVSEKEFRHEAASISISEKRFLVIEPKGVLTELSKLKHGILSVTGKISLAQILFVEMNNLLTIPEEARATLGQLPFKLQSKINAIFTQDTNNGNRHSTLD